MPELIKCFLENNWNESTIDAVVNEWTMNTEIQEVLSEYLGIDDDDYCFLLTHDDKESTEYFKAQYEAGKYSEEFVSV